MNKKSGSDGIFPVPATRHVKTKKRTFCQVWLENPAFQLWLQPVQHNPYKGKCTICDIYMTALKSNLLRHANTQEHIKNVKYGKGRVPGDGRNIDAEDVEADSSGDNTCTDPATKKGWRQTFVADWLGNPAFQPWLQPVEQDPHFAKCTFCDIFIKARKYNLQQHAKSEKHMKYGKRIVPDEGKNIDEVTGTDAASSMDVEADSSSENTFTDLATKKGKRQTFVADWLEDPAFQPWLQPVEQDQHLGKCTFCDICIIAKRCNLQQHAKSEKHLKNMKYGKRLEPGERTMSFSDELKVAEIRVCIDAIENDRSFHSFIHFMSTLQKTLPDEHLLKHMSLKHKKMAAITKNVISKSIITKIMENLRGKFFSVLVDETADTSDMKIVFFLVRYVHKGKVCTDLLDLVRIKEYTAENVYQSFRHSLNKYNLPITNMVGVCVDNANGMVGAHNSLTSRLLADNGEICILPCISHWIDSAARKACECLPRYVDKFLHSLYSYFSRNPKELSMLEGTQQFIKVAKRRVAQPSESRWLARSECIKRVLNQWTVLVNVFAEASSERHADAAKRIFTSLNCLYTKAYLQFMDYILVTFTQLNKLLQSSNVLVHRLIPECYRLLKTLGGNFLQSKYLKQPNIHKINVNNEENLLPLIKIFTGAGCMTTLSKIPNGNLQENRDMTQFYTNIKNCYQSAFQNIVNRVPFDDTFLNALDFLNPQTALDIDKHQHEQLNCILNKFKSKFNHEHVLNEWRLLPFSFSEETIEQLQVMSLPQFWHEMSITTGIEDEYLLPNISKVAQLCLSLPHSNADVEQYFSTVTQIKSGVRSRLNPETAAAITRIKLDLKNKNEHWNDYEITDDMLNLFDNTMYNKEEIPEELIEILLSDEINESDSDNN